MDTMEAAGIPNFLVTIDKGSKRIVVLNQPFLYTEQQKPWGEISRSMKGELDLLHAHPSDTTWLANQDLQPQDTTWYIHPILHQSGLYAAVILAGFGEYARYAKEDLIYDGLYKAGVETDVLARVRTICIDTEAEFQRRLTSIPQDSANPHTDFANLVKNDIRSIMTSRQVQELF